MAEQREQYEKQMGAVLENFQKKQGISREEEDLFATSSEERVAEPVITSAPGADGCYSGEQLTALVDRVLPPAEEEVIRRHLKECESCREQCMKIASLKMGSLRTETPSPRGRIWRYFFLALLLITAATVWYIRRYLNDGTLPF